MNTGFISLHRSLMDKGWYNQSGFVQLWVHILLKANHKDKEFWFNGQNINVKRGQFVTGRKVLSVETGLSESKIDRILKVFESEQQIEQQTNNRNRLISILNYDKFQISEQPANNQRTTSEQQVNTNNNENKENNEIKKRKKLKPIEERLSEFKIKLGTHYKNNLISKEDAKDFFEYWTEMGDNDKKMRWEKERSYNMVRRINTWLKNKKNFEKEKSYAKKEKDNHVPSPLRSTPITI